MADQNLTRTQTRVDEVRDRLFSSTPDAVERFLLRHEGRLTTGEAQCIRFAFKAIKTDSSDLEATQELWDEWSEVSGDLLESLPLTERAIELHTLADSVVEAIYCAG